MNDAELVEIKTRSKAIVSRRRPMRFILALALFGIAPSAAAASPVRNTTNPTARATDLASSRHQNDAARERGLVTPGLVTPGLEAAPNGSTCDAAGLLHIVGTNLCTHGPDAAPVNVDGRDGYIAAKSAAPTNLLPPVCEGDGITGYRSEVLYVRSSDHPDNYDLHAPTIEALAQSIDSIYYASAVETGGNRRVRFVHTPGASCRIIVRNVVLAPGATADVSLSTEGIKALGYTDANRKYLAFVDDAVYCGLASIWRDDQPGPLNSNNGGPSYARIDNACWTPTTATHEFTHMLGGVQNTAPHATGGGAHCVDAFDLMCYPDYPDYPPMQFLCNDLAQHSRLDCNHDDYFNTKPRVGSYLDTHWNVSSNAFLIVGPDLDINGNFATATPLYSTGDSLLTSNVTATPEAGEPIPLTIGGGHSLWYSYVPTVTGTLTVDNCGSDFDTVLGVYTGTDVTALSPILENNDDPSCGVASKQSRVTLTVTGGSRYNIEIDGVGAARGNVLLRWSLKAANDDFANREVLPGVYGKIATNTVATSKEAYETTPFGDTGGHTLWYSYTPIVDDIMTIDTCGSGFDTILTVYKGLTLTSATPVVSNDDSCATQSSVTFAAVAGMQYSVQVAGAANATGALQLRWLFGGDRSVSVSWSSSNARRIADMAIMLNVAPDQVQKNCVYLVGYLVSMAPSGPVPVTLPRPGSSVTYVDTWTPDEFFVLDDVKAKFVLTDSDATRFSVLLIDYLFALSGL